MSIEFSQELDAPIIIPTLTGQDAGEVSLRPKLLADYTGQEKSKGNLSVGGGNPWTTHFSTALPAWAKPP